MRIDCLTLFPEMFDGPLNHSIIKRASDAGIVQIALTNIRDFSADKHKKVDDKPYGGGPGQVLMCQPVFDCFEHIEKLSGDKGLPILLTPQGQKFSQAMAQQFSLEKRLILIAGRYEGFDERIRTGLNARQVSIGDYVLSGGELAAMVIIDAVVRLLAGALGDEDSAKDESFSELAGGFLEYPQYTRPEVFRDLKVPQVLLSGDHAKIADWRRLQALERTQKWRPDLGRRRLDRQHPDVHVHRPGGSELPRGLGDDDHDPVRLDSAEHDRRHRRLHHHDGRDLHPEHPLGRGTGHHRRPGLRLGHFVHGHLWDRDERDPRDRADDHRVRYVHNPDEERLGRHSDDHRIEPRRHRPRGTADHHQRLAQQQCPVRVRQSGRRRDRDCVCDRWSVHHLGIHVMACRPRSRRRPLRRERSPRLGSR